MTVGSASFYRLRGSFSSGEYPLLATGQDLTSYRLNQATVKYAAGLQTEVTVPMFTGYQDVNVIELDGSYYWATAWRESTTYNGSVTYACDYMAPTSLIKSGQVINAYLDRSPTYITKYLSDDWTKGEILFNESASNDVGYDLPSIIVPGGGGACSYWYQITGIDSNGDYHRYGGFAITAGGLLGEQLLTVPAQAPDNTYYPTILDILNNATDFLPFAGSDIKDISISRRCPYNYTNPSTFVLGLVDLDSQPINPGQQGTAAKTLYDIDELQRLLTLSTRSMKTITMTNTDTVKLTGEYVIRDWNKNIIASFPVAEGNMFYSRTYADISGIYTIITNGKRNMTIPEGKLPWSSSSWEEYKAYEMVADRAAMRDSIRYAENERNAAIAGSIGESVISGVFGGAVAGGGALGGAIGGIAGGVSAISGAISTSVNYDLSLQRINDQQKITEIRARMGRGTGYNIAYGLIYLTLTMDNKNLAISYASPISGDSSIMQAYVDRVGYPCEGLQQLAAVPGFYKGYIPVGSSTGQGMFYNELNRVMRQGFKFISL